MINMILIGFIGLLAMLIAGIVGFACINVKKLQRMGIKQDKCPNFKETPKFYYLIEWRSIYAKTFPYYNRIIVDGDVSEVRKQINKLRKKYKKSLTYKVYEQRNLTDSIDWE